MQQYDFDVIVQRYVQLNTPGVEQKTYFGSEMADIPGIAQFGGHQGSRRWIILVGNKSSLAKSRKALINGDARARPGADVESLYVVPQWYKGVHNIAYWNKFRPAQDQSRASIWGCSIPGGSIPKKAAMIAAGKAPSKALSSYGPICSPISSAGCY